MKRQPCSTDNWSGILTILYVLCSTIYTQTAMMMCPRDLTLGRHPSEIKALGTRMTISLDRKCRRSLRHDSAGSLGSNTRIVIFEKRHQFAHCSYVHCLVFTLQRKTEENKTGCPFSLYGSQLGGGGLVSLADCRTHIGHFGPNAKFSYLLR